MANIISISCHTGPYQITPEDMSLFVENWISDPVAQRKFRFLTRDQSIGTKHMLIPDFSTDSDEKWLYKDPGHNT